MVKNKPNRPLNQSFQKGCARLRYTTDTGFKVVHVGGKSAADKSVITAADVNNFAAATWTVVNAGVSKHNPMGSHNFGSARSYTTRPQRAFKRAPTGPRRGVEKSERTPSHEDSSISLTSDARVLATTNPKKAKK